MGGGGGGAQMGPGGQFSAEVDIPAPMVGKLIGKGGETIKQLQYSTQTKVQIDHQSPGDLKRVTISGGSRETVEAAKKQVEQIVSTEDASGGGASRSVECPQVCAWGIECNYFRAPACTLVLPVPSS